MGGRQRLIARVTRTPEKHKTMTAANERKKKITRHVFTLSILLLYAIHYVRAITLPSAVVRHMILLYNVIDAGRVTSSCL